MSQLPLRACSILFQSTLPRRERPSSCWRIICVSYFNPRSREGSDGLCVVHHFLQLFQSTLPRRERPAVRHCPPSARISIHAPAKGATRPRKWPRRCGAISIHAPAKGATRQTCTHTSKQNISIHAPAKGATAVQGIASCDNPFQSTLPRRERQRPRMTRMDTLPISIHAPAKGATHGQRDLSHRTHISIHAPAKGATLHLVAHGKRL